MNSTDTETINTREEALERTRGLLPLVKSHSESADENRSISGEVIEALSSAGLFGITTPKIYGGSELGLTAMVEVTAALASVCGSTGWVYGVLAGHNWMLSLFPEEAQNEVFTDSRALTATVFRLNGTSIPEKNGFRLKDGAGRFCSGIDFADWVIVGNSVQYEDGREEPRYFLINREDVEVVDDWFTVGMRGTCSRSIRISDVFIPEHRSILSEDANRGVTPGSRFHSDSPMYQVPFRLAQPFSLVGVPLGIAEGALNTVVEMLQEKFSDYPPEQIGEQGMIFGKLSEVDANISAARLLILHNSAMIDSLSAFNGLSRLDRARIQRDFAYVARVCRSAVTSLFEGSGGSAIYSSSTIQRFWRDGNSATAHAAFNWNASSDELGRAILDLTPSRFSGPRR